MARSNSGKIVLVIDPTTKRKIYESLARSGRTLKDWFVEETQILLQGYETTYSNTASARIAQTPTLSLPAGKRFKVISMFSGCGGMDLGFKGDFTSLGQKYEALPYDIVWANDYNSTACATYQRNLRHHIHRGDVWEHMASMPTKADIIIGGFPCQDISVNGKQIGVNGKRSGLYRAMVEAVRKVRPKIFIAENVKNLLTHDEAASLRQVVTDFEALGYEISYELYNTANYGVAQTRERVIIVGIAKGGRKFEPPLPVRTKTTWITAKQALQDLENNDLDPNTNHIWSRAKKSPQQGSRKLLSERPAHTMRAECHGNIQFHYCLPRRMSMREAARVQSFPDQFIFEGGIREIERQVGNAVPPVFAWHVAKAALGVLAPV